MLNHDADSIDWEPSEHDGLNFYSDGRKSWYHCTQCEYYNDRLYHAKKHFQRVHVQNGRNLLKKQKYANVRPMEAMVQAACAPRKSKPKRPRRPARSLAGRAAASKAAAVAFQTGANLHENKNENALIKDAGASGDGGGGEQPSHYCAMDSPSLPTLEDEEDDADLYRAACGIFFTFGDSSSSTPASTEPSNNRIIGNYVSFSSAEGMRI